MKLLMIIGSANRREDLQRTIVFHSVHAYSELPRVLGEGKTGKHFGTHTWLGRSVLIFTVVPKERAEALARALRDFKTKVKGCGSSPWRRMS